MKKNRLLRYQLVYLILFFTGILLVIWNFQTGSVELSTSEILEILFHQRGEEMIIWEIRFPRIVAVIFLGGALSVSGFLLQTFFANPIAGPFVLGISSGAKMVISIVMIVLLSRGIYLNSAGMILAAFAGSLLSMGIVLLLSGKVKRMSSLVICGVMIGYICSAVTDFLITFAEDSNIVNLHHWSMGTFNGMTWDHVKLIIVVVTVSMVFTILLSKPIGAYQLGESYARNMGVRIPLFRLELILLSSILSASVTAFAGPISFVGIAVPHLMKKMMQSARPLWMIPACFLGGSVFCLFCDMLARSMFAPTELSISTVTAVFGAPVVILLMVQNRKEER